MKNFITIVLFTALLLVGCNGTRHRNIEECSTVTRIEKVLKKQNKKYWIVTEDYNFYTNNLYQIGDTIRLLK